MNCIFTRWRCHYTIPQDSANDAGDEEDEPDEGDGHHGPGAGGGGGRGGGGAGAGRGRQGKEKILGKWGKVLPKIAATGRSGLTVIISNFLTSSQLSS